MLSFRTKKKTLFKCHTPFRSGVHILAQNYAGNMFDSKTLYFFQVMTLNSVIQFVEIE